MHHHVHARQPGVGVGLFLAVEDHGVIDRWAGLPGLAAVLDEVPGLHEHARRAAGRVEHHAVVRLDDVHDHPHQRGRREELAAFLRAGHGELVQKVFVDAPEHVPGGSLDRRPVEDLDQLSQQPRLEGVVAAWQGALEDIVLRLDRVHRLVDDRTDLCVLRQVDDAAEAGGFGQVDGGLALKTQLDDLLPLRGRHLRRDGLLDLRQERLEAVVGVAQENQAQHGHRIVSGGELGIGAQLVGRVPKLVFELLDVHG